MKSLKLMIVEDEYLFALQMKMNLMRKGYSVCKPVSSGELAVELARKEKPDIILMDIRLAGEIDGIEAARRIAEFSSALIVFITGYPDASLMKEAMSLNPIGYLIKPIELDEFEALLQSSIS